MELLASLCSFFARCCFFQICCLILPWWILIQFPLIPPLLSFPVLCYFLDIITPSCLWCTFQSFTLRIFLLHYSLYLGKCLVGLKWCKIQKIWYLFKFSLGYASLFHPSFLIMVTNRCTCLGEMMFQFHSCWYLNKMADRYYCCPLARVNTKTSYLPLQPIF